MRIFENMHVNYYFSQYYIIKKKCCLLEWRVFKQLNNSLFFVVPFCFWLLYNSWYCSEFVSMLGSVAIICGATIMTCWSLKFLFFNTQFEIACLLHCMTRVSCGTLFDYLSFSFSCKIKACHTCCVGLQAFYFTFNVISIQQRFATFNVWWLLYVVTWIYFIDYWLRVYKS